LFWAANLGTLTDEVDTLRVQLSHWKKKGWISSLKRGLYVLGPEERVVEPSLFYLANQIYLPSYVSLESALAFHDLIPEFVGGTTSVTPRKTARFENVFGVFTYQTIDSKVYEGFESQKDPQGLTTLVARPEKALVDFFYLNLSDFDPRNPRLFYDSYRLQNLENLDRKRLREFTERFETKKLSAVVDTFLETL
jgi:predicted transcriptional regulator of viral defense system